MSSQRAFELAILVRVIQDANAISHIDGVADWAVNEALGFISSVGRTAA
jgi:hypothetical protein